MKNLNFRKFSLCPTVLGLLLACGPLLAQQQPAALKAAAGPKEETKDVAIPTCLERVTLTAQQQDQVKELVRQYDAEIASAKGQFGNLYLDSIRTEVLTPEQERAADKLQETYLSHLRSLNRDIQGLHIQLVSLEGDKLAEIENVLTEDQLLQLREIRKTAPAEHAAAAQRASPSQNR